MNPTFFNAYKAAFNSFWFEYDLLCAAVAVGLLAFIGVMAMVIVYAYWTFGDILEEE